MDITQEGDRFISQRVGEDATMAFTTKMQLFASPQKPQQRSSSDSIEMNDNQDKTTEDTDQTRTYQALLQNQILGVTNPHLLHEIHNVEDYHQSQQLYTRMQKEAENMESFGSPGSGSFSAGDINSSPEVNNRNLLNKSSLSPFMLGSQGHDMETSPYKSKFTVLKFSPEKKPQQAVLQPRRGGDFSTPSKFQSPNQKSSNFSNSPMKLKPFPVQQSVDQKLDCAVDLYGQGFFEDNYLGSAGPFSTGSSIADSHTLENKIPIDNQLFEKRSPFFGLDEDQVMIPVTKQRVIAKNPYKVLDAPALQDDYYLNLVDWSSMNDLVVGLQSCIYIWSASSSKVTKLYDLGQNDTTTSVNWARAGSHLAVGTDTGLVQVWDVASQKLVRVYHGHEGRVGALAWTNSLLSSGSKDRIVLNRDLRDKSDYVSKLSGHKQEVCGLKWSLDEQQLASGGNDNKLMVWSPSRQSEPLWRFTSHKAAVKALAWSPHQKGLLVSGGGTADRCIRFWNTMQGCELQSIQTESQVCNLMFSRNSQELVSTHGYSENAVCIWKYPSMRKIATLTGHNLRVLYLAMSPDGESIVTGAGDETLRFWKVFPKQKKVEKTRSLITDSAFVIR